MKSIKHWTPSYVVARGREVIDHRLNPNNPWLTRQSVALLDELLMPGDVGLEFGGGRSTPWIAQRIKHLTSVDDSAEWHAIVRDRLAAERISNVDLALCPRDVPDEDGGQAAYVKVLDRFADNALDFCLVDGMYRDHCALGVINKLKSGGLLVIDNASWFLPSFSTSPASQPPDGKGASATWQKFLIETADWRRIWTYSGVTATVIYFKR